MYEEWWRNRIKPRVRNPLTSTLKRSIPSVKQDGAGRLGRRLSPSSYFADYCLAVFTVVVTPIALACQLMPSAFVYVKSLVVSWEASKDCSMAAVSP